MKENNDMLCCELQLQDLGLDIRIYKVAGMCYYKIFHQEIEILSDFDILYISFDLKGIIDLLSFLGLNELADHETLTKYVLEYKDEKGKGPRTEYFQKAFKTHNN